MATQTAVYQTENRNIRKIAWRADAVLTMLTGDLMLFAPSVFIDLMGMSESASSGVQGVGIVFVLYGLWALWAAHTGIISRLSYYLAVDAMALFAVFSAALLIAGVEFSTLGQIILVVMIIAAGDLAWFWWGGARQNTTA